MPHLHKSFDKGKQFTEKSKTYLCIPYFHKNKTLRKSER